MSLRRTLRTLTDRLGGAPFERALDRAAAEGHARIVFFWNRGLGDIALGLVPMFVHATERLPGASIEVVTRAELEEPFRLTAARRIHVVPGLARGDAGGADAACARLAADPRAGALAIDDPDPTRWIAAARRVSPPRLAWDARFDALAEPLVDPDDPRPWIAVHPSTETARHYRFVKDWPAAHWRACFAAAAARTDARFVLVGHAPGPGLEAPNVLDLRGRTGFLALLALIRTRCAALIAPDGGVLNAVHYLDATFPLRVVSLWADPNLGLMKLGARSPNPALEHRPLIGTNRDVSNVLPAQVLDALLPLPR